MTALWAFFRAIVRFIYKIIYNISFEGTENLPKDGGYVFASNHRSYQDPVFITLKVRRPFNYMAKEELFHKNFFFTALIKLFGAFPVERGKGDMSVITSSVERLEKGKNLVIFPEGTRSYDGRVGRGKTGVALIAAKSGHDVVPVGINFKGEKLHFRSKVVVRFGKIIKAEELHVEDESPKNLKVIRNRIMTAIKELVDEPEIPQEETKNAEN